MRLKGMVDIEALQSSMDEMVRRHEVLRTSFPSREGVAVQEIAADLKAPFKQFDLRDLRQEDREAEAKRIRRAEAVKAFDVARGPLLRVTLLRMAEQEYVLLLTMHHIIVDGWSKPVMAAEITELYRAHVAGEQPKLPELPIQYADFAVWQREWLQTDLLERQLAYWKNQLDGLPDLELPTDYPRRATMKHLAGTVPFHFSNELTERLKDLSRRQGTTLFMTLMGGFQTLMSWLTDRTDVAVGTDLANRNWPETEALIGFFVNQVLLRTNLDGNPEFSEVLRRVRKTCLEAYAYQDIPFDKVVEALVIDRDSNRSPLIEVKLVLHNMPYGQIAVAALDDAHKIEIEEERVSPFHAKFDLLVTMSEREERLEGVIDYRSELFDPGTIEMIQSRFEEVLRIAVEQPDIRLCLLKEQLDLLEEQAARQLSAAKLDRSRRKSVTPVAM
jgi:hypothetical protein